MTAPPQQQQQFCTPDQFPLFLVVPFSAGHSSSFPFSFSSHFFLLFTSTAPVVDVLLGGGGAAGAVVVWSLVVGIRSVECAYVCAHIITTTKVAELLSAAAAVCLLQLLRVK